MLYSLVLLIFMGDGSVKEYTLSKNLTSNSCVDHRDYVRGGLDFYNKDVDKLKQFGVEFIDTECVEIKKFY